MRNFFKHWETVLLTMICSAGLVAMTVGYRNAVKAKADAEYERNDHVWEELSNICEMSGFVWSWEDKACYRPEHLRRIHRVKPASKGMV